MPFLSDYDSNLTWEWLRGKDMTTGQYKRLTHSFGYSTWKKEHLCYCPECVKEDRATYGETYWHRLPQLPGVCLCPKHQVPLRESLITKENIRFELIPAEYVLRECLVSTHTGEIPVTDVQREQRISKNSKWLLENGLNFRKNYQIIKNTIEGYELSEELEASLTAKFKERAKLSSTALLFLYKLEAQGIKSIQELA